MAIEKGFQKLTFTYEATKLWFDALQVKRCRDISIPITEAYNRVLAEDVVALEDLPRFDRSAMDGYAVRAEDTNGATQQKPLLFRFAEGDELADQHTVKLNRSGPVTPYRKAQTPSSFGKYSKKDTSCA